MYSQLVRTQDQALCHLYFHCCMKDGVLSEAETDGLAERFVTLGMQKNMSFKDEMDAYKFTEMILPMKDDTWNGW